MFTISKDPKWLHKILAYIIMGDGGVYGEGANRHCYFTMNMRKRNLDYVEFCASVIREFTSCSIKDRNMSNTDGCNREEQVTILSRSHPVFTKMREHIYNDISRYKGISEHYLKALDWESLAILYVSDGSLCIDKAGNKGLVNDSYNVSLNMKRLSYGDLFILKKALKEYLDLEWNINRQGKYYYLRLRCKDVTKFMHGVSPFVFDSFKYKLVNA